MDMNKDLLIDSLDTVIDELNSFPQLESDDTTITNADVGTFVNEAERIMNCLRDESCNVE